VSRRPRFLPPAVPKRTRSASPAWATRAIVVVAVLIVVGALVITIVSGTLFTAPGSR